MPKYASTPPTFTPPQLLMEGVPCYLFGTYNFRQANTKLLVSNVAITTNVATLTVQIVEGEIPTVGSFITVAQTQTGSGEFNVSRVALTAVSISASTGAGTVSYALTGANVSSADSGTAIVEVPEIAEALTANGASVAVAVPPSCSQETLTCTVTFPTAPTGATATLQTAVRNVDGEFTNVGNISVYASSAYSTGPTTQFTLQRGSYYRVNITGLTGTGTIVAKVV